MNSQIQFIYSDLAGVQYDFQIGITRLLAEHGIAHSDFSQQVALYEEWANRGEISLSELIEVYENILEISFRDNDFLELWTGLFTPNVFMHKILQKLSKHYRIGLLTNIHAGLLESLQEKKLIVPVTYEPIIQSYKVHHIKPEKEIYLLAQHRAGVQPESILFIDDNPEYIAAAQKVGWHGILFEKENMNSFIRKLTEILQYDKG